MEEMKSLDSVEVNPTATLTLEDYMTLLESPAQTPPIPGLKARLDKKTGRKVLCGRIECDGQLGKVRHRDEADFERINAAVGDVYSVEMGSIDYVEFPPGWTRRRQTKEEILRAELGRGDEVWELSAHARKRVRRGLAPKLRSYPDRPWMTPWNSVMGPSAYGLLPVVGVCPKCEWRSAILPELVLARVFLILPTMV